jgi:methionine sulfoxide reductase heme-binding subunit
MAARIRAAHQKALAAVACSLPLAKMALDAAWGGLGANPIEAVLNRLGFWTLTLLTASLAATPLHDLAGLAWPVRVRRLVGLFAFAYATLHFLWYLAVDQGLLVSAVAADVVKRPFITIGFATLLILVPLAVTSTDGWVRRLGFRAWKGLHRLVYLAALTALVHFAWRVKADHLKPAIFAVVVGTLLAARAVPPLSAALRRRASLSRARAEERS